MATPEKRGAKKTAKKKEPAKSPGAPVEGLYSVSKLSTEFSMARETVRKRINGLEPAGEWRGHPTYRLVDAVKVLFPNGTGGGDEEEFSSHNDRLTYLKAEKAQIELEAQKRELIPVGEVEHVMGEAFKQLTTTLDTLPDVLERDAELRPDQVSAAIKVIDGARESLYNSLVVLFAESSQTEN